jgi:hypothetical protein
MGVLTLAMKERMRVQSGIFVPLTCNDNDGSPLYCGDCLADLPDPWLRGSHVCGQAVTVERAFGGLGQEVIGAEPGDTVWFLGQVPSGYGRVYEVTAATVRGLRLLDVDQVLCDVRPMDVVVIRKAARR